MDPFLITVFTFVLLLVLMVGGFVMIYPLSRRLARWVDLQLEGKRGGATLSKELEEVRRSLGQLEAEVAKLTERQTFTESMLSSRTPPSLPPDNTMGE